MHIFVLTAIVYCEALVGAAPPLEGDAALLQLLRDAQNTNRTLFDRGELKAEVSDKVGRVRATATVIWNGPKTYWNYTFWRVTEIIGVTGKSTGKLETQITRQKMIETSNELMSYRPSTRLAQRVKDKSRSYPNLLKVRPQDVWFRIEGVMDWGEILDPAKAHENVTKYVVRKKDGDRVVVERHHTDGTVLRMEADLKMGGNIVTYEEIPARGSKSFWRKGSYDWAQDKNGNWYLKRYAWQRSSTGDPDELHFDYTLNITDFNPNPVIPRDRFEFASLQLESGTTVKEVGGQGRTYRVGGVGKEQQGVSQNQLDGLAETLRAGGFASPDRNSK